MNEARSDSLYERLRRRGLLDNVMRQLLDGERDAKSMVKFLRGEGVATSLTAIGNMVKLHGLPWRHDESFRRAKQEGFSEDKATATQERLQQLYQVAVFEADSLKELRLLAQITGDTEKLKQAERKVRVAEEKLRMEILKAQTAGAVELDAIIADAEKLEALRLERSELVQNKASDAERIEAIRRRMYGAAAVLLTPDTEGRAA